MVNAYKMHKCTLESNKLENVDFLSLIYQNRSLESLELIDQRFIKEKPKNANSNQNAQDGANAGAQSSESDDSGATRLEVVPID